MIGQARRIELSDGDFIDTIWYGDQTGQRPIVLLLHGLGGNEHSHYIRSAVNKLIQADYRVLFMFHRGCSSEHNRLNRTSHSGETGDLLEVLNHIENVLDEEIYAAIGYSLGGNVLLKYLGEQGDSSRIPRAISISTPYELQAASHRLNQGFSRVYQRFLIGNLLRILNDKYSGKTPPVALDEASIRTFFEFDERITARLNGFNSAQDYYTRSSSRQFIPHIRKPCLIIHALDDPFLPQRSIPLKTELPECVTIALSEHGGHVGFLSGNLWPKRWLNDAILSYLDQAKPSSSVG